MKELDLDTTDRIIVIVGDKIDLDITIAQAHKMLTGRKLDLDPANVKYLIKKTE